MPLCACSAHGINKADIASGCKVNTPTAVVKAMRCSWLGNDVFKGPQNAASAASKPTRVLNGWNTSKRQSGWQYWRSAAALSADAIRSRKSTTTRLFCTCRCAGPSARRPRAWAKAGAAKGAVASARPKPPKACLLDTLWGWSLVPPTSGQFDSLVRLMAVPSTLTLAVCLYPLSAGCGRVRLVPRSTAIDCRCDAT